MTGPLPPLGGVGDNSPDIAALIRRFENHADRHRVGGGDALTQLHSSQEWSINAVDFGADPRGIRNSGWAVNLAIAWAAAQVAAGLGESWTVYCPAGTYLLDVPIVPKDDVWLKGAGWKKTIFKIKGSANIDAIATVTAVYRARFSDFCIDGNKANNASAGIGIHLWLDHGEICHVWFRNIKAEAIYLCPADGYAATSYPSSTASNTWVWGVEMEDSDVGLRWTSLLANSWVGPRCNVVSTTANVYVTSQTSPVLIFKNWLGGTPVRNIHYPSSGTGISIQGNVAENSEKENILITEPASLAADHNASISITENTLKNASRTHVNTYNAVHIEGYDATHRAVGVVVANNDLVTDTNTPKYGVYLKHVKSATVSANDSQVMGTGYWKLDGGANDKVSIRGNAPEDWVEERKITVDVPVANTVTETALVSFTVQGGNLCLDKRLRLFLEGDYLYNNAADTVRVRVKYGATTMISKAFTPASGLTATRAAWQLRLDLVCDGATNAQRAVLGAVISDNAAAPTTGLGGVLPVAGGALSGTAAEDSTADKTLSVTVEWSAASNNDDWTLRSAVVEMI